MTPAQAHCARCGAPIIWATNDRGKPFAVDTHPSRNGQWFLAWDAPWPDGPRAQHAGDLDPARPRIAYRAHFATCAALHPTGRNAP